MKLLALIFFAVAAQAQVGSYGITDHGVVNFTGSTRTAPFRVSTGAPTGTNGTAGDAYYQSDATAGQNIWLCTATGTPGTWTQLIPGSSPVIITGNAGFSTMNTGANYYWPGLVGLGASAANGSGTIPFNCTAGKVTAYTANTVSGGSIVVDVYDTTTSSATAATLTIPNSSVAGVYTGSTTAALNATHIYSIRSTNNTGSSIGAFWMFSFQCQ